MNSNVQIVNYPSRCASPAGFAVPLAWMLRMMPGCYHPSRLNSTFTMLPIIALTMVLAACGGGGRGASPTVTAAAAQPTPPVSVTVRASVAAGSANQGSVSGGGSVFSGQSVTLTATPSNGYVFARWTDGSREVSINPIYTMTASTNMQLVAHFVHDVNGLWTGSVVDSDESSHGVTVMFHNGTFLMGWAFDNTILAYVGENPDCGATCPKPPRNHPRYIYSGTYSTSESGDDHNIQFSNVMRYEAGSSKAVANFSGSLEASNSLITSDDFTTHNDVIGTLRIDYGVKAFSSPSSPENGNIQWPTASPVNLLPVIRNGWLIPGDVTSLTPLVKTWQVDATTWGGLANYTPAIETGIVLADGTFRATDVDGGSTCSATGSFSLLNPGANLYGVTITLSDACHPANARQYGDYRGYAFPNSILDSTIESLAILAHNGDHGLQIGFFDRPRTSNPTDGFTANVFEPSAKFKHQCDNPRSNIRSEVQGSALQEKYWIRSFINEEYFWYDQIADIDPADIADREDYFEGRKHPIDTKYSWTQATDEYNRRVSGTSYGYGMEVDWRRISSGTYDFYVIYTEPNSQAALAGIGRGDRILQVDTYNVNTPATNAEVNAGYNAIYRPTNGATHSFLIRDRETSATRTVSLTAGLVTKAPVQNVKRILTSTGTVGYLTFNTFGSRPAEKAIVDAIQQLIDEGGVDDLVLDLRYNGGGFVTIAAQLGYMIAGDWSKNHTFMKQTYNDKNLLNNHTVKFRSTSAGFLPSFPRGQSLPTLNLGQNTRSDAGSVYILSTNGTASASEAVFNGLRGVDVNVYLIGTKTYGKPFGSLPNENCGLTFSLISFEYQNAKGFADFAVGFKPSNDKGIGVSVPGCYVEDDFSKDLGDENEAMLAAALQHRLNGACPAVAVASAAEPLIGADTAGAFNIDAPTKPAGFLPSAIMREEDLQEQTDNTR